MTTSSEVDAGAGHCTATTPGDSGTRSNAELLALLEENALQTAEILSRSVKAEREGDAWKVKFQGKNSAWQKERVNADRLTAERDEARKSLEVVRQSLTEQAAARADATMPVLIADVVRQLRADAEAAYACAGTREERLAAHGLSLLCDWQDRALYPAAQTAESALTSARAEIEGLRAAVLKVLEPFARCRRDIPETVSLGARVRMIISLDGGFVAHASLGDFEKASSLLSEIKKGVEP